ncbi:MAG: hypothetical protein APF77_21145 [Clostridia bacterium BRH_c25]|nr:MAG: hypothetical protein APF77_21145 [Clostridia bacterium BRH_c25]
MNGAFFIFFAASYLLIFSRLAAANTAGNMVKCRLKVNSMNGISRQLGKYFIGIKTLAIAKA